LSKAAYATGAEVADAWYSATTYGVITDCVGDSLFAKTLTAVKASLVFAVGADEGARGATYVSMRVHFLNGRMEPTSAFFQAAALALLHLAVFVQGSDLRCFGGGSIVYCSGGRAGGIHFTYDCLEVFVNFSHSPV
jgi:hypothetical protein